MGCGFGYGLAEGRFKRATATSCGLAASSQMPTLICLREPFGLLSRAFSSSSCRSPLAVAANPFFEPFKILVETAPLD
jgi:hypothetical protein